MQAGPPGFYYLPQNSNLRTEQRTSVAQATNEFMRCLQSASNYLHLLNYDNDYRYNSYLILPIAVGKTPTSTSATHIFPLIDI